MGMLLEALDGFFEDSLPPFAAACYTVERRAWFLDEGGKVCEMGPLQKAYFPLVAFDSTLLMIKAVEMQLLAAASHDPIEEVQVAKWFDDHDIPFAGLWEVGDTTLARTTAEYLGMRPIKTDHQEDFYKPGQVSPPTTNLILHNPVGVVSVTRRV